MDAAAPGDVILLNTTGVFSGTFIMRPKSCPAQDDTCYITIRSGVTSSGTIVPTTNYPAANVRIAPTQTGLATLTPSAVNSAAIRTVRVSETGSGCAVAPCVTAYWKLQWLNILGSSGTATSGGGTLVEFGSMNGGADAQDTRAKEPHHIIMDQVVMHGDPIIGHGRGLLVAARDSKVTNSWLYDFKSQNEIQGIWAENFTQNVDIINNHIEGSGETVFTGGAIPTMKLNTTVTGTPTATTMTMADPVPDWVYVGQGFSFVSGGLKRYSHIVSFTGSTVTFESNRGLVPDVPGAVNMSLVQRGLNVLKNHIYRPPSWKDPIVGIPQSVNAVPSNIGGTLACTTAPCTYAYKVVARMNTNTGVVARSTASVEVSATIVDAGVTTGSVLVSWAPVPNAFEYYAYGRSAGGENVRFVIASTGCTGTPIICKFTDTGATGTTEAVPTTTGSVWNVKNLLEIKKGDSFLIEGNVLENNWRQGQEGYAILFTVANNSVGVDGNDSVVVRNITVRHNIFRHTAHLAQVTMHDASGDISDHTRDITFFNNLGYDISNTWGLGKEMIIFTGVGGCGTSGSTDPTICYVPGEGGERIKFDHNTLINDTIGSPVVTFDWYKGGVQYKCYDCDITNNMMRKQTYGLRSYSPSLQAEGAVSWGLATDAASTWASNVMVGSSCPAYPGPPPNTLCPTEATFQSAFANFAQGDYRVTSQWTTASTTGGAIGADLSLITPLTDVALSGNNTGTPPVTPPSITTSTLPSATVGTLYSFALTATGGVKPYSWSLAAGSALPSGLTLTTAGLISGTPTTATTSELTVRVTGADVGASTQTLSLAVNENLTPQSRPDRVDFVEIAIFRRDNCATDIAETIRVGDMCFELSTGFVFKVTATSPTVTWERLGYTNLSASNLTTGTVPIGRLGTNTPTGTTFLRGDNTWATPAGSGSVVTNLMFFAGAATTSWNGLSTGVTEFQNAARSRVLFDLTGYTQCRLYTRVTTAALGATADVAYVQYSTDSGVTWNDLWGTTPGVDLMTTTTNFVSTAYTNIVAGAKADVSLRVVANITGTLTGQPVVNNIGMNCK